jgi:hypothetical protein
MPAPITTACLSSVSGHLTGEGVDVETAVVGDGIAVALALAVVAAGGPPTINLAWNL